MFSIGVSSWSCVSVCFSICASHPDWVKTLRLRLVRYAEVDFMFKLQRPETRWWHELLKLIVCHESISEGNPYFIYEYAAWSFLIFNKEIWFTHLFVCRVNDWILVGWAQKYLANSSIKCDKIYFEVFFFVVVPFANYLQVFPHLVVQEKFATFVIFSAGPVSFHTALFHID